MGPDESPFPVSRGRRCLDVLVGGLALVVLLPVLLLTAVAILLSDGTPLFHRAVRVGEGGRPFPLHKLRTMRTGPTGPAGPAVTTADDVRITRLGRVLRRLSLDELPQLWSVVRGQMTLVGPRPESVELAARYPKDCRDILLARPGLTGPAQLRYRERSATPPPGWDVEQWYLEVLVPLRASTDLAYLRRADVRTTLHYLALTALFVVGLVDPSEASVQASRPASGPRAAGSASTVRTTSESDRAFRH